MGNTISARFFQVISAVEIFDVMADSSADTTIAQTEHSQDLPVKEASDEISNVATQVTEQQPSTESAQMENVAEERQTELQTQDERSQQDATESAIAVAEVAQPDIPSEGLCDFV